MVLPIALTREARPKAVWTMQKAHDRTGHTYAEALQHLLDTCFDIEAVQGEYGPACQICREHDTKRLISRHASVRTYRPFYRLCWDAIPMRDGYMIHLYDNFLGHCFVERTLSMQAPELVRVIRRCMNICQRRWNFGVVIIRLDGQQSLLDSIEWSNYLIKCGSNATNQQISIGSGFLTYQGSSERAMSHLMRSRDISLVTTLS